MYFSYVDMMYQVADLLHMIIMIIINMIIIYNYYQWYGVLPQLLIDIVVTYGVEPFFVEKHERTHTDFPLGFVQVFTCLWAHLFSSFGDDDNDDNYALWCILSVPCTVSNG